ncbi:MAG: DUF222 domain-containing protein [Gordonia sp. (in: high G+C Gram-positive bacteria)]|uniref:DUF222 domain-containing protein n=1 Tax=Gordonia sp. (in: high G+C Gram-positive bacteria) TaxID=84139 RepID=UPI0039E48C15
MIHRDDGASPWARLDLTGVGMTPPDPGTDERTQGQGWLLFAAAAHRGEAFLRWSQLTAVAEFLEITLGRLADLIEGGEDQRDLFDPWTVTIEEVAIVFALPIAQAKALVSEAVAATDRLPSTAALLRDGIIDPAVFTTVVDRTDIVDERAPLTAVDHDLAEALAEAGHLSAKAASKTADRIVEIHDTDAVKRRYEKKNRKKNVTHRDYPDGLGGLHITADAEETRLAQEAVNVLAAACCPNDPRTIGQRRSAAAIACLRRLPFTCACAAKEACTAELDEQQVSQRQAAIVIHAVCQKSTLDGENDLPAHLDGHGPISAAHVRELAQRPDAIVRDLDLDALRDTESIRDTDIAELSGPPEPLVRIENTSRPGDRYRPTAALDTLARAVFGTCTLPGCEHPAWSCHLDHVTEFDHRYPASGGPTCLCNLAPKCLKHHLLKTHLGATNPTKGWVDDLWIDPADGTPWTSITVHGITVDTRAPNQWLLPQLENLRCRHQTLAPPGFKPESIPNLSPPPNDPRPPAGGGIHAVTAYKHAWRRAARARLRRARERVDRDLGPPPF